MKKIHLDLGPRSYDICIGPGLLEELPRLLTERNLAGRVFLITNNRVFDLHGEKVVEVFRKNGLQIKEIFIPDGEPAKNIHTVENIYTYLIAQRADRTSVIAALGGGVTGDIAGFAAATYLRGVAYVQIPTTLLAQVDSSVGGKTGVNHPHGKNMIGVFHQPSFVCIDTATLETLRERDYRSGLYEVIKYGLISDLDFFEFLEENLDAILSRQTRATETMIGRCCEIKAGVTSRDERETDLRRILNFGHTFGHAAEVIAEFRGLTHGEAVAWGMRAACRLSRHLGLLEADAERRISRLIGRVGTLPPVDQIGPAALLEAMGRDKKRLGGRQVFVLLDTIGRATLRDDIPAELVEQSWTEVVGDPEQSGS